MPTNTHLTSDDYAFARRYHDKAVEETILRDLKKMAAAVLCHRRLKITESKDGQRFNSFESCDPKTKEHCRYQNKKYKGEIYPGGYCVYANSIIGIYCQVIELMAGDEINVPFTQFPEYYVNMPEFGG